MANGEDQLTQQQIAEAEAERDRLRLENMSALGATLNSLGQGLTFGFSDELAAGMASAFMAPFSKKTFDEIYDRQIEKERGLIKAGQEKYPWLSVGAEIVGGIPTGLGLYKAGTTILKNAPRLARLMGIGAVEGGIYGSGVAGEEVKGRELFAEQDMVLLYLRLEQGLLMLGEGLSISFLLYSKASSRPRKQKHGVLYCRL